MAYFSWEKEIENFQGWLKGLMLHTELLQNSWNFSHIILQSVSGVSRIFNGCKTCEEGSKIIFKGMYWIYEFDTQNSSGHANGLKPWHTSVTWEFLIQALKPDW
jgi:hypothetical protein